MDRSLASLLGEARAHARAALAALLAPRSSAARVVALAAGVARGVLRRRLDVRLALVAARSTRLARARALRPRRAAMPRRARLADPSERAAVEAVLAGLLAFGAFERRGATSLRALERILTP
jgi:hypothetical protein